MKSTIAKGCGKGIFEEALVRACTEIYTNDLRKESLCFFMEYKRGTVYLFQFNFVFYLYIIPSLYILHLFLPTNLTLFSVRGSHLIYTSSLSCF
jgi:hypothetical protein